MQQRLTDRLIEMSEDESTMLKYKRIPWHQQDGHRPDFVDEFIDDNEVCMEKMEDGLCGWRHPCTRHPVKGTTT